MDLRNRLHPIVIALVLLVSASVFATDTPVVPADGLVFCTVCHGVQLMGNVNVQAPRLSGMATWAVEQNLRSFRNGWRGTHEADLSGMEMRPMAAALSNEMLDAAVIFVNATESPLPDATLDGDANAGKTLFASCAACHGADANGDESLGAPALGRLDDWYLLAQLNKFRDGSRGSHPRDDYGQQMRASVQILSDDQAMLDVVRYITTLHSGPGD